MPWDSVKEDSFYGIQYSSLPLTLCRGYIQRCNDPPVRNLITWGAQHNGIGTSPGKKTLT
jgi:Palmitoyl protein thioesterase